MIDTTLAGVRCRATKEIRSHQGVTARYTEGTIQYDIENCGRHLISVIWDNGLADYAYPFELELIHGELPLTAPEGLDDQKIIWS